MEMQKQRHPKHLSTPSSVSPEPQDSVKMRQSGSSDGTDTAYPPANLMSPQAAGTFLSQEGSKDSETGEKKIRLKTMCFMHSSQNVKLPPEFHQHVGCSPFGIVVGP